MHISVTFENHPGWDEHQAPLHLNTSLCCNLSSSLLILHQL